MEPLLQIEKIDVYSPNGNGPINYWVQEIIEGRMPELDKEIHYWVHVRDVERAVETLQTNNIAGVFSLSGRRAWNQQMVLDEITRLWLRFQNAVHGTHTAESLSDIPSPAAFQVEEEHIRPNLAPLHEALVNCGTDGWRPLIAMRVGLMECIAAELENTSK
ncbi:MAG: hypothetical protein CMB72_03345 [Euryarchaeota archaeon]|mgnify:FL=1|nr:hypothetical protein [Euryarchaeota archaeon]|tara:strand:+ start:50 stop:532 length:483 start_codon:yes stop_codon:yes gene_type:complete